MSEATPGPWTVEEGLHYEWHVRGPDGPPNIEGGMPTERWVARECPSVEDANLIAAAPTMLAALEAFSDIRFHLFGDPYLEDLDAFAKTAEAAIRTAIGNKAFEAKCPGSADEE